MLIYIEQYLILWIIIKTIEFFLSLFDKGSQRIKNNFIAIGAFVKVEDKEYTIGSILCELKNEKSFYNSTKISVRKNSLCEKLFCWYDFCYIMTIGVIDECRNLGLGSQLLNEAIRIAREKSKKCMGIYLHVIEYNSVAIRFYLKNEFIECSLMRSYYFLNQNFYNAKVLCKLFTDNIEKVSVQETISHLDEPDADTNPNFVYSVINETIGLLASIFCCCKK